MLTSRATARAPTARAHIARSRADHGIAAVVAVGSISHLGTHSRHLRRYRTALLRVPRSPDRAIVNQTGRGSRRLLDPRKRRLGTLCRREHAEIETFLVGKVLKRQLSEDVVHQTRRQTEVRVVSEARRLKLHVRVLANVGRKWNAVLEPEADRDGEGVHDARERGTLLGDLDEDLTRAAVFVLANRDVALAVGHTEGKGLRQPAPRETLPDGTDHHRLILAAALILERPLELRDPCGKFAIVRLRRRSRRH